MSERASLESGQEGQTRTASATIIPVRITPQRITALRLGYSQSPPVVVRNRLTVIHSTGRLRNPKHARTLAAVKPICALLLCASLSSCSSFPVRGHSEAIKTPTATAGEQRGADAEAWQQYVGAPEQATLFHDGQKIEPHVP